jgi:hypothetical protein
MDAPACRALAGLLIALTALVHKRHNRAACISKAQVFAAGTAKMSRPLAVHLGRAAIVSHVLPASAWAIVLRKCPLSNRCPGSFRPIRGTACLLRKGACLSSAHRVGRSSQRILDHPKQRVGLKRLPDDAIRLGIAGYPGDLLWTKARHQ